MKINVIDIPTLYELDWGTFHCFHVHVIDKETIGFTTNYDTGDIDTYDSIVSVCEDCGERVDEY